MAGSSLGAVASGWKVKVACPVTVLEWLEDSTTSKVICCAESAVPGTPLILNSVVGGPETTVMVRSFSAVCEAVSLTWTVNVKAPTLVGVPLRAPVVAFRDRPAGKAPVVIDHVYGCVPPVAANVCEYAEPTVPPGSGEAVVMLSDEPLELIVIV